jgi:signal-transduction protein with cAMP-binding, CBS, and nucleotidyltransferase domain
METVRHVLELKGRHVYTTSADATIDDAVAEMCRVNVGALLVVDAAGDIAGVLSERDLLIRVLLAHRDPAKTKVGDVMTRKVICVDEDYTIFDAMALMTRARCRHLPVTAGGVVGIVSLGDLVHAVHNNNADQLRVLHDYVEGRYPG